MSMTIPASVDELTPTWFSEALDADVASVEVIDAHSGTTGRARVRRNSCQVVLPCACLSAHSAKAWLPKASTRIRITIAPAPVEERVRVARVAMPPDYPGRGGV